MRKHVPSTLLLSTSAAAYAASPYTNTLTGFTGDTIEPATQAALAAAGLEADDLTLDHLVSFGASGTTFGLLNPGDFGRNYLRTIENDYATVSFAAFITIDAPGLNENNHDIPRGQQSFFGLGRGQFGTFGVPDWGQGFASVFWCPKFFSEPAP